MKIFLLTVLVCFELELQALMKLKNNHYFVNSNRVVKSKNPWHRSIVLGRPTYIKDFITANIAYIGSAVKERDLYSLQYEFTI